MKRRFDLAVHFPSQTELPPSLRRAFRFAQRFECPPGGVVHLGGLGVMPLPLTHQAELHVVGCEGRIVGVGAGVRQRGLIGVDGFLQAS